ncbi:hypothetical protein B566_EDAN017752 [Ephemera danica]|nr:hypothetical protein B566_EDAN017752 [Ephemera danica]
MKVHLRNPSSYTPIHESRWSSLQGPKSLTLGSQEKQNYEQIAQFSQNDAKAYVKYEHYLNDIVSAVEPLLDLSAASAQDMLTGSFLQRLKTYIQNPEMRHTVSTWNSLGENVAPLLELITAPATKILDRWFESEPLKATLATDAVIGAMVSPYNAGTGYVLLHHVMGELEGIKGAWGYPEGGMGGVTQAMASAARSFGVHIFTGKAVQQILCNGEQGVSGIVLDDGEEYNSKLVLSNATPHTTFLQLLPKNTLDSQFEAAVKSIDYTSPVTKINVAVSRLPTFSADPCGGAGQQGPHHQTTIHLNCESTEMLDRAYRDAQLGKISDRPMLEMVIPSSLDKTLAPPGAHVCLIFSQYTPYTLTGGQTWDKETKENYAKKIFLNIDEYAPGFSSSVVGYEVLSPPDLEEIFGITGGNIFHGSMSLDQLFILRGAAVGGTPSPRTPVRNLLLCGSGAHPGGGVMGSAGLLAAREALRLLFSSR